MSELCSWQGEGVTVADVGAALERLRSGQERTAVRTSVVTLVVLATDADEEARACSAVSRLGGRHPGRTIVVRCEGGAGAGGAADGAGAAGGAGGGGGPAGGGGAAGGAGAVGAASGGAGGAGVPSGPRVDAEVRLEGADAEGVDVWWEEVRLRVWGEPGRHLDSLVEPLLLPDLPVALWFVGRLPTSDDPLLGACDAVLVDTKEAPQDDAFALVEQLLRRHPVVDLSWVRTRPWRRLLASLFDGEVFRPFVHQVTGADVVGKPGPRRLLAGWLVSRLGLPTGAVRLDAARHVRLRLETGGGGGAAAVFEVCREEGERVVRASASIEGGPHHDDRLSLPDESLPWSLAEALTHLERDRGYEQAVHALLGLGASAS